MRPVGTQPGQPPWCRTGTGVQTLPGAVQLPRPPSLKAESPAPEDSRWLPADLCACPRVELRPSDVPRHRTLASQGGDHSAGVTHSPER